ncbi:unnamed protein product [Peniophora sp. CBMAI 1063]|nr:unnamed protein product [Peniophora sp. CBMAI 1063]
MARGTNTRFRGSSSSSYRGSSSSFRGGNSSYRGNRGRGRGGSSSNPVPVARDDEGTALAERFERTALEDEIDAKMGFPRVSEGARREGWLINMHPTTLKDADWPSGRAAVDYYFITASSTASFKATLAYEPYFYIGVLPGTETVVEEYLVKRHEGVVTRIVREMKEDLKQPNHLLGARRTFLQLCFRNVQDLLGVRRELLPLATANAEKRSAVDAYADMVAATSSATSYMDVDQPSSSAAWGAEDTTARDKDPKECIVDIREYDVPYYLRVAMDNEIRVGLWYGVTFNAGQPSFKQIVERVGRPDPVVVAYDIETTKAPLKFPDSAVDQVMMISYMIDGQGYLITNREIVSEDIDDFEYTPKEGYEGPFTIFNEPDEAATLTRFFTHMQTVHPTVMATFNGDFFDMPFLDARSKAHGIDMFQEIGFARDAEDEYKSRTCVHMDCFRWVKRDSYLPQGSQGLKAVTVAKLGYDPIELDPELMTPYALDQPQTLAQYSVSDAVATYYLYMKYVHPFIFSLCNIIPLCPDEVLRKGTGTLCETLLMVEAYRGAIIMPNRHEDESGSMYEGHLVASETYVGGHVEALEAGVFRSDIETEFKIEPKGPQKLINELDAALRFCIVEESKIALEDVTNYDAVKEAIKVKLEEMRDNPLRKDKPLIYHLDVAAMYPNIMLSNRLQPDSVVDESVCATCDFNRPGKTCDRRLPWAWRGEFFPARRDEYNMIRHALSQETFPPKRTGLPSRRFHELAPSEQTALLHKRLGDYSRKVYKKVKDTKVVTREAIICQRENPFYVDTVRRFRDRRYEYKGLHKTWKKNLDGLLGGGASLAEVDEARKLIVVYDSLQLAHKCILNSFYGYVMRKGARWHSMEMAGVTCLTGASIIQMARQLVEQIGRPLELDTDGIWCMLPGVFPENFKFELRSGKSVAFSYPCTMLNHLVHDQYTNHQYHDLDPDTGEYVIHSENSIFFELDGPYRAMILPSSKEEDKLLKKRYAVFNDDGSLAELKGFEVKRRGELQLIKIFQSQIFDRFLLGSTTSEAYAAVAEVADRWLNVLFSRAADLSDEELVELIAENRSMSKTLKEYGGQKSTSISTAKRLAEFLGDGMVKDKGLACRFIISARPAGTPVTERAVPVAIFSAEESVKRTYLRKWLKDASLSTFELRDILDWNYYIERLGSVIQKLITIPAAMQHVDNPVPRIRHPDWLHRRVAMKEDRFRQNALTRFAFSVEVSEKRKAKEAEKAGVSVEEWEEQQRQLERDAFGGRREGDKERDMEDFGAPTIGTGLRPQRIAVVSKKKGKKKKGLEEDAHVVDWNEPAPVFEEYQKAGDYPGFVYAVHHRWVAHARQRATREVDPDEDVVPEMFKGALKKRTAHARWDVVQLRPTRAPGKFTLWLRVDGDLVNFALKVKREFYIHFRNEPREGTFMDDQYDVKKVTKILPRGFPCANLYHFSVEETMFQEGQEHFLGLMNDPNVDGVYELQIPLAVRAMLKLGKTCAPDDVGMTLTKAQVTGLDLNDLDRGHMQHRTRYLDGGKGKYLLLYHACSPKGDIHVFVIFPATGPARVHIVDPAPRRQPIPRLREMYAELLEKQRKAEGASRTVPYPDEGAFVTTYHSSDATACKALSRELGLLEGQGYTIVLSSAKEQTYFDALVPKLARFPILTMPKGRQFHVLDGLQWQTTVAKMMLRRYFSLGLFVDRMVALAEYYDVPVGHIDGDQLLFLCDMDFARRVVAQDGVLWWSPSDKPDLGGIEDDKRFTEELPNTEFVAPGCYANVCLEITVRNLAVNSVLHAVAINELEGSGGTTAFDAVSHTIDEFAEGEAGRDLALGESNVSPQVFALIKSMVRAWLLDKIRHGSDTPATLAVDHFFRWISSRASCMYDPSIHRFVHGLMRKTFIQLLAEFKRLGSQVVYADFGRILLVTSKPPGTAHAYATYITTAATSHELFEHLYLRTERFYDFLLFMDPANAGGVVCEDPLAVEPPQELTVEMRWDIQRYLPPVFQRDFAALVQYFLVEMYRVRQKANAGSRAPLRVLPNGTPDPALQEAGKAQEIDAARDFITRRLTRKLFRAIESVQTRLRSADVDDPEEARYFEFPVLAGGHLVMKDAALEFVKFACAVFELAREHSAEVGVLKRNALELVGYKAFGDNVVFRNPCDPLRLPHVPCTHCDALREFDFCRDPDLSPPSRDGPPPKWRCGACGGEYDRGAIESELLEVVYALERSFAQQDLRCTRCKQIRSDDLSKHCACSGTYALTIGRAEVRRRLKTIVNVARLHRLPRLMETSEALMG